MIERALLPFLLLATQGDSQVEIATGFGHSVDFWGDGDKGGVVVGGLGRTCIFDDDASLLSQVAGRYVGVRDGRMLLSESSAVRLVRLPGAEVIVRYSPKGLGSEGRLFAWGLGEPSLLSLWFRSMHASGPGGWLHNVPLGLANSLGVTESELRIDSGCTNVVSHRSSSRS